MVFDNLHVTYSGRTFFIIAEREMSDFSGNPFADPEDVNPFAVSLPVVSQAVFYVLLIQDPAITSVTEPPPPAEEYNPFADQPPPPPQVCVT